MANFSDMRRKALTEDATGHTHRKIDDRVFVVPGDRITKVMPHSQPMMELRVAGSSMDFELSEDKRTVQLFRNGPIGRPIDIFNAGLKVDPNTKGVFFLKNH